MIPATMFFETLGVGRSHQNGQAPRPLVGFRNRKFDISSIKQLAIYFRCINEIEMNPSDPKQMEAPGNKELNRDQDDPGGRAVDRRHFLSTGDKTCGFNRIDKSQARAEDRGLRQLYFVFPREGNWRAFSFYELVATSGDVLASNWVLIEGKLWGSLAFRSIR